MVKAAAMVEAALVKAALVAATELPMTTVLVPTATVPSVSCSPPSWLAARHDGDGSNAEQIGSVRGGYLDETIPPSRPIRA